MLRRLSKDSKLTAEERILRRYLGQSQLLVVTDIRAAKASPTELPFVVRP